tara:strand:- start:39723 stop:40109 length:387 start_codon:yes stop_codon:yes gene_type:complete
MGHEQKPGMIKKPNLNITIDDIHHLATAVNCSAENIRQILDVFEHKYRKKEFISLSDLSKDTSLTIEEIKLFSAAIDKLIHTKALLFRHEQADISNKSRNITGEEKDRTHGDDHPESLPRIINRKPKS